MAQTPLKQFAVSCLYLKSDQEKDDVCTSDQRQTPCIMCDQLISGEEHNLQAQLQKHLLEQHKLMIADIDDIADLPKYCSIWKDKFRNGDLTQFCAVIKTNCGPDDCFESENYYMLGGDDKIFEKDSELRRQLADEKLDAILRQLQLERSATDFERRCIFCRKVFSGNRSVLFDHIAKDHNFSVGHPDNIVNCSQLLDVLESKLNQLQCLYCEKTFKSWMVLKEHMRKKQHKMLRPDNKQYDRFYLINYLSPGKDWQEVKEEVDEEEAQDESWNDWVGEDGSHCVCLFCKYSGKLDQLKEHLQTVHHFDFDSIVNQHDFYSRIKLVNYIRRCIYDHQCHVCCIKFSCDSDLQSHLQLAAHSHQIPQCQWDCPEFYFPTYENDNLLHFLESQQEVEES